MFFYLKSEKQRTWLSLQWVAKVSEESVKAKPVPGVQAPICARAFLAISLSFASCAFIASSPANVWSVRRSL